MTSDLQDELITKIMILNEVVWEHRFAQPDILDWQSNFRGHVLDAEQERLHALYLLTHLTYFGLREIRELLRCMFRDFVRAPILRELKAAHPQLLSRQQFEPLLQDEISHTRFIGMGNPAESGTHLLYYFRQEAGLKKDLFVHAHQLYDGDASDTATRFQDPDLRRIVFIDDVCGSGNQSIEYSRSLLPRIRAVASRCAMQVEISYLVLLGSRSGIARARQESAFDTVECVSEMDPTFATYSDQSRVFAAPPPGVSKDDSLRVALHYGRTLEPSAPLGYGNGQLLLAFHHNVPDNTLPIIWAEGGAYRWTALMKRLAKIY